MANLYLAATRGRSRPSNSTLLFRPRRLLDRLDDSLWLVSADSVSGSPDLWNADELESCVQLPWCHSAARTFACYCACRALRLQRAIGVIPSDSSINSLMVAWSHSVGSASRSELECARLQAQSEWDSPLNVGVNVCLSDSIYAAMSCARDAIAASDDPIAEHRQLTKYLMERILGIRLLSPGH